MRGPGTFRISANNKVRISGHHLKLFRPRLIVLSGIKHATLLATQHLKLHRIYPRLENGDQHSHISTQHLKLTRKAFKVFVSSELLQVVLMGVGRFRIKVKSPKVSNPCKISRLPVKHLKVTRKRLVIESTFRIRMVRKALILIGRALDYLQSNNQKAFLPVAKPLKIHEHRVRTIRNNELCLLPVAKALKLHKHCGVWVADNHEVTLTTKNFSVIRNYIFWGVNNKKVSL